MIAPVAVGLALIAVALYGLAASRNLVRMLVAMEIITVGILLVLTPVFQIASSQSLWALVLLISMAASEVAVFSALIYRAYALTKSTDVQELRKGGEGP